MDKVVGSDVVRVATLNLWGRRGTWVERRSVLAEGFRELSPDLVAFQEAIKNDDGILWESWGGASRHKLTGCRLGRGAVNPTDA